MPVAVPVKSGQMQMPGLLQVVQFLGIGSADVAPFGDDLIGVFELRIQKSADQFAWQIRRTNIHPGVFVHFAPEKLAAVGAFLADDLGATGEACIVYQQRATLAADDVLGLMKTQQPKCPMLPNVLTLVRRKQCLCSVLDDQQIVLGGDRHDVVISHGTPA